MLHFIDKEINTYLLTHGLQKNSPFDKKILQ